MDASSAPAGRAESDLRAASTSGTNQENGENPPTVLSGRAAHDLSDWGPPPVTVWNRTRGQNQRLDGEQPAEQPAEQQQPLNTEIADALLAAAYEWTKSGSIQKSTSWPTEDAMA